MKNEVKIIPNKNNLKAESLMQYIFGPELLSLGYIKPVCKFYAVCPTNMVFSSGALRPLVATH